MLERFLDWLYPGLGIKRWLLLFIFGVAVTLFALLVLIGTLWSPALLGALGLGALVGRRLVGVLLVVDVLLLGSVLVGVGAYRVFSFGRSGAESAGEVRASTRLSRGPNVVAIGGGHGLAVLLRGLKSKTSNLTAIVTMADDGGSSGLLRRGLGLPPPGDLRSCLVALADDESIMSKLFRYRFPDESGLLGHSFGNLFMAALAEVTGDFELAVRESTRVLRVRGRVLPSTLDDVVLHAQLEGGGWVSGESTISSSSRLPRRVWLTPSKPKALPEVLEAIRVADLIVLGPGSLYTSVIPNLLLPEIRTALAESDGCVVYVTNVMTQPGETDGYTAADHLEALQRHGMAGLVDVVLINSTPVPDELLAAYSRLGSTLVALDVERIERLGARVAQGAVIAEGDDVVRHDPERLVEALLALRR